LRRHGDRLRSLFGTIGETVFEVGGHREIDGIGDSPGMRERFVAGDASVHSPQHTGFRAG
jgi:hypothetical protein